MRLHAVEDWVGKKTGRDRDENRQADASPLFVLMYLLPYFPCSGWLHQQVSADTTSYYLLASISLSFIPHEFRTSATIATYLCRSLLSHRSVIGSVSTMLGQIYGPVYTQSRAKQNVSAIAFAGTVL